VWAKFSLGNEFWKISFECSDCVIETEPE